MTKFNGKDAFSFMSIFWVLKTKVEIKLKLLKYPTHSEINESSSIKQEDILKWQMPSTYLIVPISNYHIIAHVCLHSEIQDVMTLVILDGHFYECNKHINSSKHYMICQNIILKPVFLSIIAFVWRMKMKIIIQVQVYFWKPSNIFSIAYKTLKIKDNHFKPHKWAWEIKIGDHLPIFYKDLYKVTHNLLCLKMVLFMQHWS